MSSWGPLARAYLRRKSYDLRLHFHESEVPQVGSNRGQNGSGSTRAVPVQDMLLAPIAAGIAQT